MTTPHDETRGADHIAPPADVDYHDARYGKFGYYAGAGAFDLDKLPAAPVAVPFWHETQWLTERAETVLPTAYAADPAKVCGYLKAVLDVAYTGNETARAALIANMVDDDALPLTAETAPMFVRLIGELWASTDAAQAAPMPFTTTMKHAPRSDGQVRTYRHHIKVIGHGRRSLIEHPTDIDYGAMPGHALKGEADAWLLAHSVETLIGPTRIDRCDPRDAEGNRVLGQYRLIGTQDIGTPQSVAWQPDRTAWLVDQWAGGYAGERNEYGQSVARLDRPASGVVGGRADRKGNGQNRHANPHGKTDTARYASSQHATDARAERTGKPSRCVSVVSRGLVPVNGRTARVESLVTYFRGWKAVGAGAWIKPMDKASRAKKAGAASKRVRIARMAELECVDVNALPIHVETLALKLASLPCTSTDSPRFSVRTAEGLRVDVVMLSGKGWRLTRTDTNTGKRVTVTRSAPVYLRSTLANALAKLA